MTPGAAAPLAERIERRITQLIQIAPERDGVITAALLEDLTAIGSPLAQVIADVLARVTAAAPGTAARIDAGVALPALAMACATLAAGLRGELGDRELEAARYEIDTLLPVPVRTRMAPAPDVPLSALRKRPG